MDLRTSQRRIDAGKLAKPVKRADGSMVVQAQIARTGTQRYADRSYPSGWRVEYRPPEEVGHADALDSLRLIPFTVLHPPVEVTPENAAAFARGTTGQDVHFDGQWVSTSIALTHKDAISAVARMRQISVGYTCDLEMRPGVAPDGTRYDCIQRNIRGNHVALVPDARAGAEAAIRMDGALWDASERTDATCTLHEPTSGSVVHVYSRDMTATQLAASVKAALARTRGLTVETGSKAREHVDALVERRDGSVTAYGASEVSVCITSTDMTPNELWETVRTAISRSQDLNLRADRKDIPMDTAALTMQLASALENVAKANARVDALTTEVSDLKTKHAQLTAELAKQTAEATSHKERADAAEKIAKERADASPTLVSERVALNENARKILGKRCDAADGKAPEIDLAKASAREVKLAVIKHVTNTDALEACKGRDEAYIAVYVDARYDAACERAVQSVETFRGAHEVIERHRADSNTGGTDKARAEMIAANQTAGVPAAKSAR